MRLALECPTRLLGHVQPMADFDFVLAHLVLQDEQYAEHYRKSKKVKFVDNSVNELGEPGSLEDMATAMEAVGGNYIISPDWLGQNKRTVEAYRECAERFGKEYTIGVLQGSTFEEALACASVYKGSMIAVPYDVCSSKEDSPEVMALRRIAVVDRLPVDTGIHLLGFTTLEELELYAGFNHVVSIDTGIPVLLGLQEKSIRDPLEDKSQPTMVLMEDLEMGQNAWTAVCLNIALLRRYMP